MLTDNQIIDIVQNKEDKEIKGEDTKQQDSAVPATKEALNALNVGLRVATGLNNLRVAIK